MRKLYSSIRGTCDFSPLQASSFYSITHRTREIFRIFGYQEIILPLLEEAGVFIRGVGKNTDIVEKQLFGVARRQGEAKSDVVLRPEGTAQVVRYYLQNSLYKQSSFHKFFYIGPMFRGERPQKGRLRQFHHIGAEAIGSDSIYLDAELISLALHILDEVGVAKKELRINTLGCSSDKEKFSKELQKIFASKKGKLCQDCQKRAALNPLRILDCKQAQCRKLIESLHLGEARVCAQCKRQFHDLLSLLSALNIQYIYEPYLVRGLDYYTHSVFEITSKELGSQDALGAGGRYNSLIKELGGPDVAAAGFALGIERILLALGELKHPETIRAFIAVADSTLMPDALAILQKIRAKGISSEMDYCDRSLKAQLRYAQKLGARFVVIVGQEEAKDNCVTLKDMEESFQEKLSLDQAIAKIHNRGGN
ncbi:MAG: histidine--tRNA ligase [Candidatus Omnitrophota bacterium]|nr:MAG: histidine--tRNA ligase [Candidatus Omnitrophota bacterium]